MKIIKDSFEDYLGAKDHVSATDITNFIKSQKHYVAYVNKEIVMEETPSQKLGSAVHCAILEADEFEKRYTFFEKAMLPFPDSTMAKNENKKWHEKFLLESVGKVVLNSDEYAKVKGMQDSVLGNPIAVQLLRGCDVETSIYGEYEFEDKTIKVRLRPDAINLKQNYFVSLKTTQDASPDGFGRECYSYNYHVKEAFYLKSLIKLLPDSQKPLTGYFIAVENKAPFVCQVYDMNEERAYGDVSQFLQTGKLTLDSCFRSYNELKSTGIAKGYNTETENGIMPILLPYYVVRNTLTKNS